jgi:hypothetical protein
MHLQRELINVIANCKQQAHHTCSSPYCSACLAELGTIIVHRMRLVLHCHLINILGQAAPWSSNAMMTGSAGI